MAVHINIPKQKLENVEVHYVPCSIKSNGEASVSKYFRPNIVNSENGELNSSFRGRPLVGKEFEVPDNYKGFVLLEIKEPLNEEVDRNIYACASFDRMTCWNFDEPTSYDEMDIIRDWIDIAEALHAPIGS